MTNESSVKASSGTSSSRPNRHSHRSRTHCTLQDMHTTNVRKAKNLPELSSLGHFLKGSSAALGMNKVKDSCEKIQHFGAQKAGDGTGKIEADAALQKIQATLTQVKSDYSEAEVYLKRYDSCVYRI